MMIGASGVGRSGGRLVASPSSSGRKSSWPSSFCMRWSDGDAAGSTPTVGDGGESVNEWSQLDELNMNTQVVCCLALCFFILESFFKAIKSTLFKQDWFIVLYFFFFFTAMTQ